MSAQDRYTKILESLVNGDQADASDLLHEAFVEKAREIWSDLVEQDEIEEDEVSEEELEEAISGEEADDFLDDIETDADEIEAEEAFGEAEEDDAEMDMEMDAEMELAGDEDFESDEEHGDVEDAMINVEDALNDLKAEFAKLMGDEADEEAEEESEESEEEFDDVVDESEFEELDESAELTKVGVDMPAGDDGKASPVKDAGNDMAKPHPTDATKEAGSKTPASTDMNVTHPGDGAKLSPESRGHGAEKKGKAE